MCPPWKKNKRPPEGKKRPLKSPIHSQIYCLSPKVLMGARQLELVKGLIDFKILIHTICLIKQIVEDFSSSSNMSGSIQFLAFHWLRANNGATIKRLIVIQNPIPPNWSNLHSFLIVRSTQIGQNQSMHYGEVAMESWKQEFFIFEIFGIFGIFGLG